MFIVVRAVEPCSDNTQYRVAVSRSKEVPVFGPPVPQGAAFAKGKAFADFILAKVINAENAAHRYSIWCVLLAGTAHKHLPCCRSEKFATMATRTRQEYLKDLASNYSSTAVVDTGQKFCE